MADLDRFRRLENAFLGSGWLGFLAGLIAMLALVMVALVRPSWLAISLFALIYGCFAAAWILLWKYATERLRRRESRQRSR